MEQGRYRKVLFPSHHSYGISEKLLYSAWRDYAIATIADLNGGNLRKRQRLDENASSQNVPTGVQIENLSELYFKITKFAAI